MGPQSLLSGQKTLARGGFAATCSEPYFSDWQRRPFPAGPSIFTVDTLHQEFLRLSMIASRNPADPVSFGFGLKVPPAAA